jgi:hypothetical protein
MVRHLVRLVIALGLVILGWSAGRAQKVAPDFELVAYRHAPGDTRVVCRKRCKLAYPDNIDVSKATEDVGFACSGKSPCQVAFAGFVQR